MFVTQIIVLNSS